MKHKGLFISFEGGEGCGKTTVISYLMQRFDREGYEVTLKREPGGTDISEQIRQITHNVFNTTMHPRTEALLMAAARAQLAAEGYIPSLEAGHIVIADRYIDSTFAYQGYGRGLPLDDLQHMNRFSTGGLRPDRTFLFDLDPRIGYARRALDGREDRIEMEQMDFFDRVRQGFLSLAAQEPERFVIIDATKPLKSVAEHIHKSIISML